MPEIKFITKAQPTTRQNQTPSRALIHEANTVSNIKMLENSPLCYFKLSINEIDYNFNSPADAISYNEKENAIIYFQDEAMTKFGWLTFKNQIPDNAGLIELFEPGTDTYLILYKKKGLAYPVAITEYGKSGECISGHYSGIYTDALNNPIYNVTCAFRVQRL